VDGDKNTARFTCKKKAERYLLIRNDLGKIGLKNSIFEKIKIDFYQNELVLN